MSDRTRLQAGDPGTRGDGTCKPGIVLDPGIRRELAEAGFASISAGRFSIADDLADSRRLLWQQWDHLEPDRYLRDEATFRRRRFGLFYYLPSLGELLALSQNTYFQPVELNDYAGGVARRFAPLSEATVKSPFLRELIELNFRQLPVERERFGNPWVVDVHQVRIVATADEAGEPAPQGPHHDGEEFGAVHLVRRRNVVGGISTVYTNDREPLASCTLREPMDTQILWDPHVMHGVSSIRPLNPERSGIRDVLLIGYTYRPALRCPAAGTKSTTA